MLDADGKPPKLTADQQYICKAMGTQLPLLPVHGEAERRLFTQLVGDVLEGEPNFDSMAIDWYVLPSACPQSTPE